MILILCLKCQPCFDYMIHTIIGSSCLFPFCISRYGICWWKVHSHIWFEISGVLFPQNNIIFVKRFFSKSKLSSKSILKITPWAHLFTPFTFKVLVLKKGDGLKVVGVVFLMKERISLVFPVLFMFTKGKCLANCSWLTFYAVERTETDWK